MLKHNEAQHINRPHNQPVLSKALVTWAGVTGLSVHRWAQGSPEGTPPTEALPFPEHCKGTQQSAPWKHEPAGLGLCWHQPSSPSHPRESQRPLGKRMTYLLASGQRGPQQWCWIHSSGTGDVCSPQTQLDTLCHYGWPC